MPEPDMAEAPAPDLIYDFGMDLCQDTDFYLAKGFRVVAIEANPSTCALASEKYAWAIESGQLTVVNKAISETGEPLVFHVCHTLSAWSTADRRLRDRLVRQEGAVFEDVIVEGVGSAEILAQYGVPYFAKIDIEGFDLVCLQGFRSAPTRPRFISTEVALRTARQQLACLVELGYQRFALVGQAKAPLQKPPRPASEGRDVDYSFMHHASGLFGLELQADWTTAEIIARRCELIHWQGRASQALYIVSRVRPLKPACEWLRETFLPLACDWYDIHAAL
jgi:FkbM family methyltransferase